MWTQTKARIAMVFLKLRHDSAETKQINKTVAVKTYSMEQSPWEANSRLASQ
jgi:hypothetical protein